MSRQFRTDVKCTTMRVTHFKCAYAFTLSAEVVLAVVRDINSLPSPYQKTRKPSHLCAEQILCNAMFVFVYVKNNLIYYTNYTERHSPSVRIVLTCSHTHAHCNYALTRRHRSVAFHGRESNKKTCTLRIRIYSAHYITYAPWGRLCGCESHFLTYIDFVTGLCNASECAAGVVRISESIVIQELQCFDYVTATNERHK